MKNSTRGAFLALGILLAGCASPDYYNQPVSQPMPQTQTYPAPARGYPASPYPYSQSAGTVESIQVRAGSANTGTGVGTVVGGVVGGLIGNQVGGGRGRTAATVAGAIGGAMIGSQMERNTQVSQTYLVGVRLDNGSYRTVVQDNVADLHVGSRVRIENERAYRY